MNGLMRTWVFRHRHALRALYGLPPEARLARLMDQGPGSGSPGSGGPDSVGPDSAGPKDRNPEPMAPGCETAQLEPGLLRPRPRRA